jgi:hypothetical protein
LFPSFVKVVNLKLFLKILQLTFRLTPLTSAAKFFRKISGSQMGSQMVSQMGSELLQNTEMIKQTDLLLWKI